MASVTLDMTYRASLSSGSFGMSYDIKYQPARPDYVGYADSAGTYGVSFILDPVSPDGTTSFANLADGVAYNFSIASSAIIGLMNDKANSDLSTSGTTYFVLGSFQELDSDVSGALLEKQAANANLDALSDLTIVDGDVILGGGSSTLQSAPITAVGKEIVAMAGYSDLKSAMAINKSEISGLQSDLDGKASTSHSHAQSDVTGLSASISAKADISHSHAQSDITNLSTSFAAKADISHSHAQSDITGLSTALSGKANASHTHSISDVTGLQTALDGKMAASYSESTPTRTLNFNFTPSSTKAVMVFYTVEISCTATISGGQTGSVELRSDTSATPTTARGAVYNANSVSLAIALTAVNNQRSVLSYLVPPGHNVRLVSSGTATINIVNQAEVSIG